MSARAKADPLYLMCTKSEYESSPRPIRVYRDRASAQHAIADRRAYNKRMGSAERVSLKVVSSRHREANYLLSKRGDRY